MQSELFDSLASLIPLLICAVEAADLVRAFVKKLFESSPNDQAVIDLSSCDEECLSFVAFLQNNNGPSSKQMLFRTEYGRIFGTAIDEFKKKTPCSNSVIIVRIAGIGKSCFRFYILWKWLHSEKPDDVLSTLDKVMINFGENYFVVQGQIC
jgi:hypothetical protein